MIKPIKTQQEADAILNMLASELSATYGISIDEAAIRLRTLAESGILEKTGPEDPKMQSIVEIFLSIASSDYAYMNRDLGDE